MLVGASLQAQTSRNSLSDRSESSPARTLEVLCMTAGGVRNADAAARLVRKLASTRGEAAATAARLGLLQDP
jgi:hypothetical protein